MADSMWEVKGCITSPSTAQLQTYTINLLTRACSPDRILTLRFPDRDIPFHRSSLLHASPALGALVTPPFLESRSDTVVLRHEEHTSFQVVRDFLYHSPIDVARLTPTVALVADRWGLHALFATFLNVLRGTRWISFNHFLDTCLPLFQLPRLPRSFKRAVARTLARNLPLVLTWINSKAPVGEASAQGQRFRESVLWHALQKHGLLTSFMRYLCVCCRGTCFDYLSFITHGLHEVLSDVLTTSRTARLLAHGVPTYIPKTSPMGSRSRREETRIPRIGGAVLVQLLEPEKQGGEGEVKTVSRGEVGD